MDTNERNQLVDMIAQAVIDKMDERQRTNALADLVVKRVLALQAEEAELTAQEEQESANAGNE